MTKARTSTRKRLVAAVAATLVMAGCSGGTEAPSAAAPAVCEAWADSDAAGRVLLGLGDPAITPERVNAIAKEFWTAQEPILAGMERQAPEEIRSDVATLLNVARAGAASGDPATLTAPELGRADAAIDRYMRRNCGYPEVRITATDRAFHGLPTQVRAGTIAITLVNRAATCTRRSSAGSVRQSVPEILALPPDRQLQLVTPLMATQSAPGETTTMFLRLAPGRHAVVDTYPEGTVNPAAPGSGPMHATIGLAGEFRVT